MSNYPLRNDNEAHALLNHLITTPELAEQLDTLHNLALYDSGDALLGPEEKEALLNVARLAQLLRQIPRKHYRLLRFYLRRLQ